LLGETAAAFDGAGTHNEWLWVRCHTHW